jgi:hypothetical protein
MEYSKAMEYESQKALSDILKPRDIYLSYHLAKFIYAVSHTV